MIKKFPCLLICAAILFLAIPASAKPQWQILTLKNGLQVIVIENHSVPLVTIELAVRNGSYTEPPEFNGLSHLYEHMFFKSNEKSKAEGYFEGAGELAIFRNATTKEEVVNYFATTVKTSLRPAMIIMRDALRYPLFDKSELDQEIQIVLDEFSRNEANPFFHLNKAMDQRLWYKYFSRKNVIGDRGVIESCTPEKMRAIQKKFYLPNNTAIIVAGDVDTKEIFRMSEELYGDWPAGEDPFIKNPLVVHPPLAEDTAAIVTQPVQAATIMIGYHGPSTDTDADSTYAADVLSFALRQQDSKFYRNLVDTGLMTGISFGYLTQRNVGPIQFIAQTSPDKLKASIKAINAEIAKLDSPDYLTDEQIESAKTLLESNEIFSREKPSEYAHVVSFWWASSGLDYYANYVEHCKKVTRADIAKYVQRYIKGKKRVVGVMLSPDDKTRIALTEKDLLAK